MAPAAQPHDRRSQSGGGLGIHMGLVVWGAGRSGRKGVQGSCCQPSTQGGVTRNDVIVHLCEFCHWRQEISGLHTRHSRSCDARLARWVWGDMAKM